MKNALPYNIILVPNSSASGYTNLLAQEFLNIFLKAQAGLPVAEPLSSSDNSNPNPSGYILSFC